MNADGKWNATANSAMGVQRFTLEFRTSGNGFSGSIVGNMGSQEISGAVDGDTLSWTTRLTQPVELTLKYKLRIQGDELSGEVDAGAFGVAPITGTRSTNADDQGASAPAEPIVIPGKDELGFDPDSLRDKYRAERDERLRSDGEGQYIELSGKFARYAEEYPYVEPGFSREPVDD